MNDGPSGRELRCDGMYDFQLIPPRKTGGLVCGMDDAGQSIKYYPLTARYLRLTSTTWKCEEEETECDFHYDEWTQVAQDPLAAIINCINTVWF